MALEGKVALVTGGGRGIGAATARLLASRGAKVVVNFATNRDAAGEVVHGIRSAGGQAMMVQADVREPDEVRHMMEAIAGEWGPPDILVSNANMRFVVKTLAEMSWEEFAQKLNDEMKAAFVVTQAVVPGMVERGYGRIVYVASGLARRPGPGFAAHGTAKAALVQFARYVAQEFGPRGITANVVSPGLVRTDATRRQPEENFRRVAAMTPLGRVATPEDVAGAIAMCASDDAGFITGVYVPVNGGASME